jgi:hypothetical protein
LLRACGKRPCCDRTAKNSNELAPFQSNELHPLPQARVAAYRTGEHQVRGLVAVRNFGPIFVGFGSQAEFTAPQQQWPFSPR